MAESIAKVKIPKANADQYKAILTYESCFNHYYNIFYELYSTTFKWVGLPDYMYQEGADMYLEQKLTTYGKVLFFYDDILDKYLLQTYTGYGLNFYQKSTEFQVSNPNGYSRKFTRENAVEILNSPYYTPENNTIKQYASKLALIDMTIMLLLNTKKIPYIIKTTEGQRVSMINFMKQMDTFENRFFVDPEFDLDALKILDLKSPLYENDLYELKNRYFQEGLRYCGIGTTMDKKERVITSEQYSSNGESDALLYTRLTSREHACEEINRKFGLDISVELRTDINNRIQFFNLGDLNYLEENNPEKEGDE